MADRRPQDGLRDPCGRRARGLWGNHGYEATYDFAWTDSVGDRTPGLQDGSYVLPAIRRVG